jgi:hypothetical protein
MYGLLADNNCAGHTATLVRICRSDRWREIWLPLQVRLCAFNSLGIQSDLPDSEIWSICQSEQLFLLTANRNDDGPDSLETTIALRGTLDSLPVLTFGDADRILTDPGYAERAAIRLMEILIAPDLVRGTGRVYLAVTAGEIEPLP